MIPPVSHAGASAVFAVRADAVSGEFYDTPTCPMAFIQLLDLRTLLLLNAVCMAICAAVMGLVWRDNRERFPATARWFCHLALQIVSFTLILLRGVVPDTLSIIVPAWLISLGFIQLTTGVALHLGLRRSLRHDYFLQAAFLTVHAYFTYIVPSLLWRSVNYSVFLTWLSLECLWVVLQTAPHRRFGATALACVMGAYALLFSGRIVYYWFLPPGPDFFQASAYDLVLYTATQGLFIALTFSVVRMVNRRLLHDLSEDIRDRLRAEETTRLSMTRLAQAELASQTGHWEFNLDTRAITNSVGAARIFGLSATQFDYRTVEAIVLPEYRRQLESALRRLVGRGEPFDVAFRIRAADTGAVKEIQSTAEFDPARRTVFGVMRDVTEQKRIEHELEHLVQVDPLTGVFSRRHFMALTERELANAGRYSSAMSVLMIDIDYFKQVNDTYGHHVGDRVLQRIGRIFGSLLREVDIVGRYGGEEFVVVLPQAGAEQAFEVAERLRRAVQYHDISDAHGLPVSVTVSVGVATLASAAENIDALLARADAALYDAKRQGRNTVCVHGMLFDPFLPESLTAEARRTDENPAAE